jgi:hypothetical protein
VVSILGFLAFFAAESGTRLADVLRYYQRDKGKKIYAI